MDWKKEVSSMRSTSPDDKWRWTSNSQERRVWIDSQKVTEIGGKEEKEMWT